MPWDHQPVSPEQWPGMVLPISKQTGELEKQPGMCVLGLPDWVLLAFQAVCRAYSSLCTLVQASHGRIPNGLN